MVWRKDHILVPGLYCHEITKVKRKSEALAGNQRFFLKEKCKKKKKIIHHAYSLGQKL